MSDIKLLEQAAKAAGYKVEWIRNSGCFYRCEDEIGREPWDSLEEDGDAFRLAAVLGLNIEWFINSQYVMVRRREFGENIGWVNDCDRPGALRRAITIVAAQIGKSI
jgi:hypothetical protein